MMKLAIRPEDGKNTSITVLGSQGRPVRHRFSE